jgi:hypothetical protein
MGLLYLAAFYLADLLVTHGGSLVRLPAALVNVLPPDPSFNTAAVGMLLFPLLFRLSWVTGYHAAEHQVVHAIEAGDDLLPDVVRDKPRVHPRCGTNIVAAVTIIQTFWWLGSLEHSQETSPLMRFLRALSVSLSDLLPLLSLAVMFFYWRRIGGWLQQHVTTRPATAELIESGLRAGKQVMERYQLAARFQPRRWQRVWNMGLLQVSAGWALVFGGLWLLQLMHVPIPAALR